MSKLITIELLDYNDELKNDVKYQLNRVLKHNQLSVVGVKNYVFVSCMNCKFFNDNWCNEWSEFTEPTDDVCGSFEW